MNILIDSLPMDVYIGGLKTPIKYDFRTWISFEQLMSNPQKLSDEDIVKKVIELIFPETYIEDYIEAFEKIMWFYSCGAENESKNKEDNKIDEKSVKCYDFDVDSGRIYAAFLQQYSIDLQLANMHWWTFKALFEGLTEQTQIVKVMSYRVMEIDSDMPTDMKKHYSELKSIYALPNMKSEEDKEKEFNELLNMFF